MAKPLPCGVCGIGVTCTDSGMLCEGLCEQWYHITCVGLETSRYEEYQLDAETKWLCPTCEVEPYKTIWKDIKNLQYLLFSLAGNASMPTLTELSGLIKALMSEIASKNRHYLEDKLGCDKWGEIMAFDDMSTFQKINFDPSLDKTSFVADSDFDIPSLKNKYHTTFKCEEEICPNENLKVSISLSKANVLPLKEQIKSSPFIISPTKELLEPRCSSKEMELNDTAPITTVNPGNNDVEQLEEETKDKKGTEDGEAIEETGATEGSSLPSEAKSSEVTNTSDREPSTDQVTSQVDPVEASTSDDKPVTLVDQANEEKIASDIYEVEDILDLMHVDGKILFLVKWKNYGMEHNSWEESEGLTGCKLLISKYFRRSLNAYEKVLKDNKEC